jgi:hypothetical protein
MKKTGILILLLVISTSTALWAQSKSTDTISKQINKYEEYKDALSRIDQSKLPGVIASIEKHRAETEQTKAFWNSMMGMKTGWMGLAYIFPFIMIILIVVAVQYFRYKKKRDLYLLISKLVESGKDVPIELLVEPQKKRSDLRRGLVFLGFGLAIIIAGLNSNKALALIGLIPLFLGIAYMISHFLIKSKDAA